MKYWMIEYVGADRFETLLQAENPKDAIKEARIQFDNLSEHDRNRRESVEVWEAPFFRDNDGEIDALYPDTESGDCLHTIK
jgi:hypothetical protein